VKNYIVLHRVALRRICLLVGLVDLTLLLAGCSTSWVTEAESIIGALIPAVQGILLILSGLGVTALSPTVTTAIQGWGAQAMNDLQNVILPLIQKYNAAEATAKPGIASEIETAMSTITGGLTSILPTLKITDPAIQAKVTAIVTEVSDEMTALLNLIPVIKGAATPAAVIQALASKPELLVKLKSEKQFKHDYNAEAAAFGPQYKNWIK
jgi:hypothetical protein